MNTDKVLYNSFNARNLSIIEVSKTFIPPKIQLKELIKNESTMLMGPRGCGKTTLLKILSPDAVNFVIDPEAKKILQKVDFISVYIPSDIQWRTQYENLVKRLESDACEFVFNSTVLLNVLVSLIKLFNRYLNFIEDENEKVVVLESMICKELGESWNLDIKGVKTFKTIELKLLTILADINEKSNKAYYINEKKLNFDSMHPLLFNKFTDLVIIGITIFEQFNKIPSETKWALCFDELELLPKSQQSFILSLLRSTNQKLIFKITSTPIINLNNSILASAGNDFEAVKLWVYDVTSKKHWRLFCNQIIANKLGLTDDIQENLNSIFGSSSLDQIIQDELSDLSPIEKEYIGEPTKFEKGTIKGSSIYFLFKILAYRDKSFKNFLEKRNIDPANPIANEETEKAVFLQFKSEAIQRLIYRNRTRKTPAIHFGLPYLFDICDGNPRLLVGLFDKLKTEIDFTKSKKISKSIQSKIVYQNSNRFYNILKNHPGTTVLINGKSINLSKHIIENIGKYFQDKVLRQPFQKSIPTTFVIDNEVNHKVVDLIEAASYYGAIIYLDPITEFSKVGLVGKRFKLSSFLCPKYKITMKTTSQANLSTILAIQNYQNQPNLFDDVKS